MQGAIESWRSWLRLKTARSSINWTVVPERLASFIDFIVLLRNVLYEYDHRPDYANVLTHHGPIVVHKYIEDTLLEVQAWGKMHPWELVVISPSHCVTQRFHNYYYADECYEAALRILSDLNIHTITNCDDLIDMTYAVVLKKGNILAVWGCSFGF